MVIKVAVPHQFEIKVMMDVKTLLFVYREDIHDTGGCDILPAP